MGQGRHTLRSISDPVYVSGRRCGNKGRRKRGKRKTRKEGKGKLRTREVFMSISPVRPLSPKFA